MLRDDARVVLMILVIAEQQDGSAQSRVVGGRSPRRSRWAGRSTVVVAGRAVSARRRRSWRRPTSRKSIALEHDALGAYTPDGFVAGAGRARHGANRRRTSSSPHTYQTRDFAPKLAARLDRALVTDCIGREGRRRRRRAFTRPMFQGKVHADVVLEGPAPHFATFQIGAFRADAVKKGARAAPVRHGRGRGRRRGDPPEARSAVPRSQAGRRSRRRPSASSRSAAASRAQEHIALAQQLAEALGAELAASRPICDAGWLPMERQIGSSGQTVAPKLYLALGISGAIQHVVGMKGARTIVAINKDRRSADLRDCRLRHRRRSVRGRPGDDCRTREIAAPAFRRLRPFRPAPRLSL